MKSKYDFTWDADFFEKPKKKKPRRELSVLGIVLAALILGAFALIALSGCADEKPQQAPAAPAAPKVPEVRHREELSYKVLVRADSVPNKYFVDLTWNPDVQRWPWAIRRLQKHCVMLV